jgi:phenylpyruvate tautomerase PptA (4-oxalocrotonate tautomerase family)
MPIYQCSSRVGLPNDDMRAQIATAITRLSHVQSTGAPRIVHVYFNELPPGVSISAGEPGQKLSGIQERVRAGRPLEAKQKLIKTIVASWSQITGQPGKFSGASPRSTPTSPWNTG